MSSIETESTKPRGFRLRVSSGSGYELSFRVSRVSKQVSSGFWFTTRCQYEIDLRLAVLVCRKFGLGYSEADVPDQIVAQRFDRLRRSSNTSSYYCCEASILKRGDVQIEKSPVTILVILNYGLSCTDRGQHRESQLSQRHHLLTSTQMTCGLAQLLESLYCHNTLERMRTGFVEGISADSLQQILAECIAYSAFIGYAAFWSFASTSRHHLGQRARIPTDFVQTYLTSKHSILCLRKTDLGECISNCGFCKGRLF
jgi:hypothetical protein